MRQKHPKIALYEMVPNDRMDGQYILDKSDKAAYQNEEETQTFYLYPWIINIRYTRKELFNF